MIWEPAIERWRCGAAIATSRIMRRILFLCGKARMRSPTAADVVATWPGFETDFAGLSNDADEYVSTEHLDWADFVIVMERRQKRLLQKRFGAHLRDVPVRVLDVPDRFAFMEPALVEMIIPRVRRILLANGG